MRYLTLLLVSTLFFTCSKGLFQKSDPADDATEIVLPPVASGPDYDPDMSPRVMTADTPLPLPPGNGPAVYGSAPDGTHSGTSDPATASSPTTYSTPAPVTQQGGAAAGANGQYQSRGGTPGVYASPAPYDPTAEVNNQLAATLTGLWVNQDDEDEVVEFTPTHYTTFYRGQKLLDEEMVFHGTCPTDCSGGENLGISCFTIAGPAGTDCFGIVRLTHEVLEMSLLGVSTETILYNRKE